MQSSKAQSIPSPLWASEPFRVFFPLGLIASAIGVLLWPAFYSGLLTIYPNTLHPRLMIFGFGLAFITGFLGTAWPRFVDGRPLGRGEVIFLLLNWTAILALYLCGRISAGDLASALHIFSLTLFLLLRLSRHQDQPPPGFAIALGTLASAGLVALYWGLNPATDSSFAIYFTRLVAYQGLLLIPLIGIGSYLYPRFFGSPGSPTLPRPGLARWAVTISILVILVSFAVEAIGQIRIGNLIRLAGFVVWLMLSLPSEVWKGKTPSTRAWGLRIALYSIASSFLFRALEPAWLFAFEHILFLAGFGLAMLLTADRVVTGHGGDPQTLSGKSKAWRWIVWLLLVAAATRVAADMIPSMRISHYIYAAILWAFLAGFWWKLHFHNLLREN